MTAWADTPIEIKLLIVHSYIDLILAGSENISHTINFAIDQISNLATALPYLRKDILAYCDVLEAELWQEHADNAALSDEAYSASSKPLKTSHWVLLDIKNHWKKQTWLEYLYDLKFGVGFLRRYIP